MTDLTKKLEGILRIIFELKMITRRKKLNTLMMRFHLETRQELENTKTELKETGTDLRKNFDDLIAILNGISQLLC
jgi:hypothetical protein